MVSGSSSLDLPLGSTALQRVFTEEVQQKWRKENFFLAPKEGLGCCTSWHFFPKASFVWAGGGYCVCLSCSCFCILFPATINGVGMATSCQKTSSCGSSSPLARKALMRTRHCFLSSFHRAKRKTRCWLADNQPRRAVVMSSMQLTPWGSHFAFQGTGLYLKSHIHCM